MDQENRVHNRIFVAVDNLWQTQYSEVIVECLRGILIFLLISVGTG